LLRTTASGEIANESEKARAAPAVYYSSAHLHVDQTAVLLAEARHEVVEPLLERAPEVRLLADLAHLQVGHPHGEQFLVHVTQHATEDVVDLQNPALPIHDERAVADGVRDRIGVAVDGLQLGAHGWVLLPRPHALLACRPRRGLWNGSGKARRGP
jgi:hypothetical protein